MMTARTEYRLLNRQDNADIRLSAFGRRIGLISEEQHAAVLSKYESVNTEIKRLENTYLAPTAELCAMLESRGTTSPSSGVSLASLLRRPQVDYKCLAPFDPERPDLLSVVQREVEISVKYEGYIAKELRAADEFRRMESRAIPPDLDYEHMNGLRIEARQKLAKFRPQNIGQASRISGVSPADITALMIHLGR